MKLVACSVYDSAVLAFNTPMFFRTKGEALRSFVDACRDGKSQFVAHAKDYTFMQLGEFDDQNGQLIPLNPPAPLMSALEAVQLGSE